VTPEFVAVPESPLATRLKPSLGVSGDRPISIVSTQLKTQFIRFGCLGRPENFLLRKLSLSRGNLTRKAAGKVTLINRDSGLYVLVASFGREIHEIMREPRPALGWHNQK
jgi:hypothetical protein